MRFRHGDLRAKRKRTRRWGSSTLLLWWWRRWRQARASRWGRGPRQTAAEAGTFPFRACRATHPERRFHSRPTRTTPRLQTTCRVVPRRAALPGLATGFPPSSPQRRAASAPTSAWAEGSAARAVAPRVLLASLPQTAGAEEEVVVASRLPSLPAFLPRGASSPRTFALLSLTMRATAPTAAPASARLVDSLPSPLRSLTLLARSDNSRRVNPTAPRSTPTPASSTVFPLRCALSRYSHAATAGQQPQQQQQPRQRQRQRHRQRPPSSGSGSMSLPSSLGTRPTP